MVEATSPPDELWMVFGEESVAEQAATTTNASQGAGLFDMSTNRMEGSDSLDDEYAS